MKNVFSMVPSILTRFTRNDMTREPLWIGNVEDTSIRLWEALDFSPHEVCASLQPLSFSHGENFTAPSKPLARSIKWVITIGPI